MNNIKNLIDKSLDNSDKGTSTTILALPGSGRTYSVKKIIKSRSYRHEDNALIYINCSELVKRSSEAFFSQFLVELSNQLLETDVDQESIPTDIIQALQIQNETLLVSSLKKQLPKILESKEKVLIIIDGISKLKTLGSDFYNSLRNIRFVNKEKINFLFLEDLDRFSDLNKDVTDELYTFLIENISYLALPSGEIFDDMFTKMVIEFKIDNGKRYSQEIYRLTHGHPTLTKYLLISLSNEGSILSTSELVNNPNLIKSLESISSNLNTTQRQIIRQTKVESPPKELTDMHLVLGETPLPLLHEYLKTKKEVSNSKIRKQIRETQIELKDGVVLINGEQTELPLTKREYKVLNYLLGNKGKVVSREQIGKAIWGADIQEKYSEWAIDQSISRLRKKLGDNAYKPTYLKTIRGRGFILNK